MTETNQTNCAPNTLLSIANSINLHKKKLELGNSNKPYQNKPNITTGKLYVKMTAKYTVK